MRDELNLSSGRFGTETNGMLAWMPRTSFVGFLLALSATFTSAVAFAQNAGAQQGAQQGAQPARQPVGQTAAPPANGATAKQPEKPNVQAAGQAPANDVSEVRGWLEVRPNGLTAEGAGRRAGTTSYQAKAANEQLRAAAARVDQAWALFLPRLTGVARYTRLSEFEPPSFTGGGSVVVTPAASGTFNPSPTLAASFGIPLVFNNYLLQANLTVPFSDYFLRINQNYTAATHAEEAARNDVLTARAKSFADAKLAYYTWVRGRGAVAVALLALNDQRTHLKDAQNQFDAGNASRADVLRAQTAVSGAELTVTRARNFTELAERQLRLAMHVEETEVLLPGENFEGAIEPFVGNVRQLISEAQTNRPEIRSLDANMLAAKKQVSSMRAGIYPTLEGVANATYANPNPRRFPATQEWFGTWDIGAQLVWSPNDIVLASGRIDEAEARVSSLAAQKLSTRDAIELEVTQAYQGIREAEVAEQSAKQQLASATEAHRVASELFKNGRATSTTLTDAETELTRARLDALNVGIDARIARVKLDHAVGRDARPQ